MRRHEGLDYRRSLRRLLEQGSPEEVDAIASRQERTVDALLRRMYSPDDGARREFALLADEVGLGKTFVALGVAWSVLLDHIEKGLRNQRILIVTPISQALFNKWQRDVETFLREAVCNDRGVRVRAVEAPHDLVRAMQESGPAFVIARMSAVQGRLVGYKEATRAVLHVLFNDEKRWLTVDQRLRLVSRLPHMQSREAVDLRRSGGYWQEAGEKGGVEFGRRHVARTMRRMKRVLPSLIRRIDESIDRVRGGQEPLWDFQASILELARAALGGRIWGALPLVIVDEIHNWKNHPKSWQRFRNMLGGRIERLLGLSATPFQLNPSELINILELRECLALGKERAAALSLAVDELGTRLESARDAGSRLADAWAGVHASDLGDIEREWAHPAAERASGLPSRIQEALHAADMVHFAHRDLMSSLRPFLVRHRRDTRHRRWRVGCDANAPLHHPDRSARTLAWRPGLDVRGDGELIHYLMMRATQECKDGKGVTSIGTDLGGSYDFFRDHELMRLKQRDVPSARPYLELVDMATAESSSGSHPKVKVTVERAFNAWLQGEKTLIFCFNPLTVSALQTAISERIHRHEKQILTAAFGCTEADCDKRLENFQKRLYNPRQSLFLLLQDHPLAGAGADQRIPAPLTLDVRDLASVARVLAVGGPARDRFRFDRRRVLAAVEQVLVARWQKSPEGRAWLAAVVDGPPDTREQQIARILSPDWPLLRRAEVEGIQTEPASGDREREEDARIEGAQGDVEVFADEEGALDAGAVVAAAAASDEAEWQEILASPSGQAVYAPYLPGAHEAPSLLTRWHGQELHGLPWPARALAARMVRRMVRSPGFLARFLLNDVETGRAVDEDSEEVDVGWSKRLHDRWCAAPVGGESARSRFNAYLDVLRKVVGHDKGMKAYREAARNLGVVARVTGGVSSDARDRLFTGFNTPLVPEVLIVTSVGQEGIDLHRECRHVIHHDLPWNPAPLEQRTGRVDRIGSKAERLAGVNEEAGVLDVVVPYIANTYDEFRFRRVHARAHLFEVTMGADYAVDTAGRSGPDGEEARVIDDEDSDSGPALQVPLPDSIANALRMRLEAEE